MEIAGEPANPQVKTRSWAVIIGVLATVVVAIIVLVFQTNKIKIASLPNAVSYPNSIAIYVVADSALEISPDLRTTFWEGQLKDFPKNNISLHYISDGDMKIGNNIEWIVPPACSGENSDPGYCERNIESWNHFVQEHPGVSWYFKANQETHINVGRLLKLLKELEDKGIDPMKQPYFQFALEENDNIIHPAAGAGWLISAAAVSVLDSAAQHFIYGCEKVGEDIALGMIINDMQLNMETFENKYFIPMWPESVHDLADDGDIAQALGTCPLSQFRFEDQIDSPFQVPSQYIGTRMAFTPMDQVQKVLPKIKPDFRIAYPSEQTPIFCLVQDSASE